MPAKKTTPRKAAPSLDAKASTTRPAAASAAPSPARSYEHVAADAAMRPEAGTQAQFRKKKAPATYRYDSSLAPELTWDGGNAALRGRVSDLLAVVQAGLAAEGDSDDAKAARAAGRDAATELARLQQPFLNWTGKAERLSFDVPTLPLFVHERLSTQAILETLGAHRKDQQHDLFDLFADPRRPVVDQVLKAYEHRDRWVNRMMLGDSLVCMNSLLQYEGMGGQVQMIYIDPPYGVKFGSNFQPFVRKRDVKHNDDADLTREPEMVQAYRDTWELGLHSYLTYLRDRLLLAKELLTPSGSVFVQISDENLHHVREVMDEVFGGENFCGVVPFKKTTGAGSPTAKTEVLSVVADYILWYAKDRQKVKYHQLYLPKSREEGGADQYTSIELADGLRRPLTAEERAGVSMIPEGARFFRLDNLTSQSGVDKTRYPVTLDGREYRPPTGVWKTSEQGMQRLFASRRVASAGGSSLFYVRYLSDFSVRPLSAFWDDTVTSGFGESKLYVVQTNTKVIQRCLLMTTDPGDLVLDPTCGSGTTAYVAEQWGRRWITMDTSRVPLALARQRLLTATFPWYTLKDASRGPAGGFVYQRKQNKRGEEVGGLVPHITLKSIANNEPPTMEVLVDRPEEESKVTRVAGPFVVEATIPTPVDWEGDGESDSGPAPMEAHGTFVDRMLEVLRRSPSIATANNERVAFEQVRPPAKALVLNAEAVLTGSSEPVAFVFGPEHGAVSEQLVHQALKEADRKNFTRLFVIGFAIEGNARLLVEQSAEFGVPATYVQATPDLVMGSLLKTTRASQVFSVAGLPDVTVTKVPPAVAGDPPRWQVQLVGLDVFDPATMNTSHTKGGDVPAWLLDSDYNGRVFRATQVFFPRTGAWEAMQKALKAQFEPGVFEHLAGDISAPFFAGEHHQIAVKVIDDRGNELVVVKSIS
ncbi:site-specific DNA-methyltransferase [Gemmatimonas sp.]|uniref:site-specific DNA-methyltransferase n=1 Tax=Gemmatimonas sp. TaxID=1962908 RepID=UPI0025C5E74D|nr:site-specific DNA-methyltransferase [Gemmatimonas sp.]MCA2996496.1 site-specific DNA-methyltransferase [Gemmatimonas sp.]